MIVHEGGKFVLYSSDGRKKISEHPTREGAVKQEQAIKAHEEDEAKAKK